MVRETNNMNHTQGWTKCENSPISRKRFLQGSFYQTFCGRDNLTPDILLTLENYFKGSFKFSLLFHVERDKMNSWVNPLPPLQAKSSGTPSTEEAPISSLLI